MTLESWIQIDNYTILPRKSKRARPKPQHCTGPKSASRLFISNMQGKDALFSCRTARSFVSSDPPACVSASRSPTRTSFTAFSKSIYWGPGPHRLSPAEACLDPWQRCELALSPYGNPDTFIRQNRPVPKRTERRARCQRAQSSGAAEKISLSTGAERSLPLSFRCFFLLWRGEGC